MGIYLSIYLSIDLSLSLSLSLYTYIYIYIIIQYRFGRGSEGANAAIPVAKALEKSPEPDSLRSPYAEKLF